MIVRNNGPELLLITQPDHAALSGELISAWQANGFEAWATRSTVLLATSEHDNGWREVDTHPTVNLTTGRPHDFINAPSDIKRGIWLRGVARLASDNAGAAALVAQHALTVLERRDTPPWHTFFTGMETEQRRLLAISVYDGDRNALRHDYRLVFLGDLLSLIFCCGWQRTFEHEGYSAVLSGDVLTIRPDPFAGMEVPLGRHGMAGPRSAVRLGSRSS